MANWLIPQTIDLQKGAPTPKLWPDALMQYGDNNAHLWRITVLDGGAEATLSGTVTGYFIVDGTTIPVPGTRSGNVVSVLFPSACYAVAGTIKGILKLAGTGFEITLGALIFRIGHDVTDVVADPGEAIPTLAELLALIDDINVTKDALVAECGAAANGADAAAAAANAAAAVMVANLGGLSFAVGEDGGLDITYTY